MENPTRAMQSIQKKKKVLKVNARYLEKNNI